MVDDVNLGGYEDFPTMIVSGLIAQIDKLGRIHKQINRYELVAKAIKEGKKTPAYLMGRSWKYKGKIISLQYKRNDNRPFMLIPDFMIGFHLCQFKSFRSFKKWLSELTGPFYSQIFSQAEIYRIDLCFFTRDFTGRDVFLISRRHKSQRKGHEIFGSFPSAKWAGRTIHHNKGKVSIYETFAIGEHIVGKKKVTNIYKEEVIKFEERYFKKKNIKFIRTLSEIDKLVDLNPFTFAGGRPKFHFYRWTKKTRRKLSPRKKKILSNFFEEVKEIGMQKAFHKHERSGIAKHLKVIDANLDLNKYFNESMSRFLS